MSDLECEYLDALDRLRAHKPTNTSLKNRLKQGKLKINISTVALEAGRSRTAIATDNSKFPKVRKAILNHAKSPRQEPRTTDTIKCLRQEIAELKSELKLVYSENANLISKNFSLTKQIERLKQRIERKEAITSKSNNVIPLNAK